MMDERRDRILEFLRTLPGAAGSGEAFEFDSLALLQVVEFIESNYGVRLGEVEPDDLRSVDSILAVIERAAAV